MAIAYDTGAANFTSSFATTASVAITAANVADRCVLAWGTCESDNTVLINNLDFNGTGLSLGADHDPLILPFAHAKFGSLLAAAVATGVTVTDSNGNAKPRILAAIFNGVGSIANRAYVDVSSNNSPSFTVTTVNGDTAVILVMSDTGNAISAGTGVTIHLTGASGAYRYAIASRPATTTSTAIALSTTGPAASWVGFVASLTPPAAGGFFARPYYDMLPGAP